MKTLTASTWVLAFALAATTAFADQGIVSVPTLSASSKTTLLSQIESERKAHPDAFAAVEKLRNQVAELDASKRGRLAPISGMLQSLGPNALLPMLEQLAVKSPPRGNWTETAWVAWRAGLIEAVGKLRDARSLDVLAAILEGPETDFHVIRATAQALGQLDTPTATQKLVSIANLRGPKQSAVWAGMGTCRHTSAATTLTTALKTATNSEDIKHIAKSLGEMGASWVWKRASNRSEETAIREGATKALLDSFVRLSGEDREAVAKAILVIKLPNATSLIQSARVGTSKQTQTDLDQLIQRLDKRLSR